MAEDSGKLQADQVFKGLTRSAMILGVSMSLALCNGMITMMVYILSSDFRSFILLIAIHGISYVISFKEPKFIEIFAIKIQKCDKCINRLYHGANSYDVR